MAIDHLSPAFLAQKDEPRAIVMVSHQSFVDLVKERFTVVRVNLDGSREETLSC